MKTKRYCFALDLIDDEYKTVHHEVWFEVSAKIRASGVRELEIYLVQNRLFMIMETTESFSIKRKQELDRANPMVQKWEEQMWKYQKALPNVNKGENGCSWNEFISWIEVNGR